MTIDSDEAEDLAAVMKKKPSTRWHVDRNVPIALIVTIVIQGAIGVWWASDITSRLRLIETAEATARGDASTLIKLSDARYERLIRLEEKLASMLNTIDRIEKKIDSIK